MKSKILLAVFILTLAIIGRGFCFAEGFYSGRVRDISDREYEQAVIELIDNAEESVVIGMYYITTQLETNNPVKLLLNDLVEAEERGVEVRIYLNTKFPDVSYEELVGEDEFKRLQDAGCEVYFIPEGRKLHGKGVIVDRRYVVEGSMNWSIIALRNNFESVTLIDSPELAEKKIARLEGIYRTQKEKEEAEKRERAPLYLDSIIERIEIKKTLLEDERYFPGMLKRSDRRAMDLYLILTAYSQKIEKDEFFLKLEDAGLGLGLPESWDDESLRRQVIKALRILEDRYNLIKVEFYHATDAHITVLPVLGESFTIETKIIDSGRIQLDSALPRTLRPRSQRLKFLLLVKALLEKEGKGLDLVSQKEIMRRFHITERTLEKALADLKK
ncbi:MAG: hypothetical protein KKD90_05135 [Candidatus Omnitrophica bacterium]|nr:hypothetical protein [Candidatus Omnitrophota bacterium]